MSTQTQQKKGCLTLVIHQLLHLVWQHIKVNVRPLHLINRDVHTIEVLIKSLELVGSQIKHCVDIEHGQLEVVLVQNIGHVGQIQLVFLYLGWEARWCTHSGFLISLLVILAHAYQWIFLFEHSIVLFVYENTAKADLFLGWLHNTLIDLLDVCLDHILQPLLVLLGQNEYHSLQIVTNVVWLKSDIFLWEQSSF